MFDHFLLAGCLAVWCHFEFSTWNFFAVTTDNKFVIPDSPAVLPSITNKSLTQLAEDEGMVVEHRPVPFEEVASFKEVAVFGTAVVMTSIKRTVKGGEVRRGRRGEGGQRRLLLLLLLSSPLVLPLARLLLLLLLFSAGGYFL